MVARSREVLGGVRAAVSLAFGLVAIGVTGCFVSIDTRLVERDGKTPRTEPPAPDGGEPSPRWCTTQSPTPFFCSDFDTEPYAAGWALPVQTAGGKVDVDVSTFTSSPRALVATVPTLDGRSEPGRARLCNGFSRLAAEMEFAFDVRLEEWSKISRADIASLRLNSGVDTLYLDFSVDGARSWQLKELWSPDGGLGTPVDLSIAGPTNEWTRVVMHVSLTPAGSGMTGSAKIYLESVLAAERSLSVPFTTGTSEICVGVAYAEVPSEPWRVRYDSVTFDLSPL